MRELREAKIQQSLDNIDLNQSTSKKQLINLISSYFQRFTTASDSKDDRGLLFLIAALTIVNTAEDDSTALTTARRLAQMAFNRSHK